MEFEKNKLEWLDFDLFEGYTDITARTFLRHGGVSSGAFESLNVSNSVGDHPDSVKVNRSIIQKAISCKSLIFAKQEHKDKIIEVTEKNLNNLPNADALFTTEKDIALAISHADCQAALFYDPVINMIAAVHCGWKGLLQDIYGKMVRVFIEKGADVKDVIVAICPSLSAEHAEFKDYKTEFPKEFWSFQTKPFYFDLLAIAKMQLLKSGVLDKNIEISDICTFSNSKDYFSFRRDRITGRHASVIVRA